MPTRETPPVGAPCWVDLMSSDVEKSRAFYGELFGWTSDEPDADFGGYFNFAKEGQFVAGGMPTMDGSPVTDIWSVYLATADAVKTADTAKNEGSQVLAEPMEVADLGSMAVITDAGGAAIGMWQPGLHQGFQVFAEANTPAWFELHTRDYDASIAFYRNVFRWETNTVGDTPEFRYTTLVNDGNPLAGIIDASSFLPEGVPNHWTVYFAVDDTDAALARAVELGGAVVQPADDTPYGRIAVARDSTGAAFRLVSGMSLGG